MLTVSRSMLCLSTLVPPIATSPSLLPSAGSVSSQLSPDCSSSEAMIELADLSSHAPCQEPQPCRYLQVANRWGCPSFRCNIMHPHTYSDLLVITAPPSGMPVVAIQRFDEMSNPFPQANRWEVAERPERPHCYGMSIYLAQYGVVMLQTVASTNAGWMLFQCIDVNSSVQAEIAVPAEWYTPVPWYARLLAY